MPEPPPPLDLAALEARHRSSGGAACWICGCWLPCPTLQLVARVRALEAEVTEATAIMQRVSARQFAGWQAVQRAVGASHRLDDATREMRIWLDDRDPAWLAARARFTADDA